jgi:glycerol uptake facilitator-like aquaporin
MKWNKTLKWGVGALLGAFAGNLIALLVFEKPWAEFFTRAWWSRWTAIYALCLIFIVIGLIRLCRQPER